MNIRSYAYTMAVMIFMTAISACTTGVTVIHNPAAASARASTFPESSGAWGVCSVYYHLNYAAVDPASQTPFAVAERTAMNLAAKGDKDAAFDAVSGYIDARWDNPRDLFVISNLLAAKLEGANWMVQLRWGPTYQKITARLAELASADPLVRVQQGVLLINSPSSMGGDPAAGEKLLHTLHDEGLTQNPMVLYGLWMAATVRNDTPAGLKWAKQYLALCPRRPEVLQWYTKHDGHARPAS